MKKLLLFIFFASTAIRLSAGNDFCGIANRSFSSGENITFKVFYNVIGLYVDAGTASFTATHVRYNNRPAYHIVGLGSSNPTYDWIFKVRDRYESYLDTQTLKPMRFIRTVDEGGYKKYENVQFNHETLTATSGSKSYNVPACVQDVLSAVYYARNIDFNQYKPGDKIPFTMFLDDEVYNLYIRYIGKETVRTRYGKFKSIKFKPMLIKGTIFEGGEKMTVWVTDDANHLPLRIESPITVGSVKVDMMGYRNLRYPLSSMLSLR